VTPCVARVEGRLSRFKVTSVFRSAVSSIFFRQSKYILGWGLPDGFGGFLSEAFLRSFFPLGQRGR